MSLDAVYMQRCLELASAGLGHTRSNPLVGCVVVHNGSIIGEGYHRSFGGPHAEVNAVAAVSNPELLSESTVYVNLEPCAHHGKTPPCADLLVEKGVRKVVIGMQDPFPSVNGAGIQRLRAAGIEVVCGVLEPECRELNRRFLTFHTLDRPYIVLKWMQSTDGYIGRSGEKVLLGNQYSMRRVHRWRSEEMGILIGPETAINDNPSLNNRLWPGPSPQRILLDRDLRVPASRNLFQDQYPLVVFNCLKEMEEGNISYWQADRENFLPQAMKRLKAAGLISVLVEGGAAIHQAFFEAGLWDEVRIGVSPKILGTGIKAPKWPEASIEHDSLLEDRWFTAFRN